MTLCLTIEEVARFLDVKRGHVYYLAYMGCLEGWKIRDTWRIFKSSVEDYAKRRYEVDIDECASGDHYDQGRCGVPSLFGYDDSADDLGKTDPGLHGRRGVEYNPRRFSRVPFKALKPINDDAQMDLFAEAV